MKILLNIIVFLLTANLFAQNNLSDNAELNNVYGADNILVNGINYSPLHPGSYGHPFLGDNIFAENNIVLKGRSFNNVLLKYDLEKQMIILNFKNPAKADKLIELNNNYIKEFTINQLHFIKLPDKVNSSATPFIQLIYSGKLIFGKTYSKAFIATYSNKYPRGKYSKLYIKNVLIVDDETLEIKRNKDLYSAFPANKHQIKRYIKSNKIKLRKATNKQWHQLIKFCDEL